jgi:hypothetical protein
LAEFVSPWQRFGGVEDLPLENKGNRERGLTKLTNASLPDVGLAIRIRAGVVMARRHGDILLLVRVEFVASQVNATAKLCEGVLGQLCCELI